MIKARYLGSKLPCGFVGPFYGQSFYCHYTWRSLDIYILDYRLYKLFYTKVKHMFKAKNFGTGRCEHKVVE